MDIIDSPNDRVTTQCFILDCQIPSGKNRIIITRTGHRFPEKRFSNWRKAAIESIAPQILPFEDTAEVKMFVSYTPGDRIRRDVTGMMDAIFHLVEKVGIVTDDAKIKDVEWTTNPVQPHAPRCEVVLTVLRYMKPSKKKKKKIAEAHSERMKFSEV